MGTRQRRPWLAVLLAFVYPGLGHVYLQEWRRALLWFAMAIGTFLMLAPAAALETGNASGVAAVRRLVGQLPVLAILSLATVMAFSMADAYYLAVEGGTGDGVTCRSCGRELDDDLEFCHWCTEPFEDHQV